MFEHQSALDVAALKTYAEELGLDKKVFPNVGLTKTVGALTASRDHTKRLLAATPLEAGGVLKGAKDRRLATAVSFRWSALLDAAITAYSQDPDIIAYVAECAQIHATRSQHPCGRNTQQLRAPDLDDIWSDVRSDGRLLPGTRLVVRQSTSRRIHGRHCPGNQLSDSLIGILHKGLLRENVLREELLHLSVDNSVDDVFGLARGGGHLVD